MHGNPAVDLLSGIKLASGGELGFGVGEEEWGSGERAVLEEIAHETGGLVDLVVARFGEPEDTASEPPSLPWLGCGSHAMVTDGLVFGGINAISRTSLRNLSLWMRQIYTFGDYAYGVRDNPNRERRKRRRRNVLTPMPKANGSSNPQSSSPKVKARQAHSSRIDPLSPALLPKDLRPQLYDRVASHDHATNSPGPQVASHPGIPPPIVSAAEAALQRATTSANEPDSNAHERPSDISETTTTMGIPDQYMKYLTFGLSTLGKSYAKKRPASPSSPKPLTSQVPPEKSSDVRASQLGNEAASLSALDPIPEGDALHAKITHQRRLENRGHFIIGLRGDLDSILQDDEGDVTEGSIHDDTEGNSPMLRTLHIDVLRQSRNFDSASEKDDELPATAKETECFTIIRKTALAKS